MTRTATSAGTGDKGKGGISGIGKSMRTWLLPTLKDFDSAISADMIQILVLFDSPVQDASAASDPHDSADIFRCARI